MNLMAVIFLRRRTRGVKRVGWGGLGIGEGREERIGEGRGKGRIKLRGCLRVTTGRKAFLRQVPTTMGTEKGGRERVCGRMGGGGGGRGGERERGNIGRGRTHTHVHTHTHAHET